MKVRFQQRHLAYSYAPGGEDNEVATLHSFDAGDIVEPAFPAKVVAQWCQSGVCVPYAEPAKDKRERRVKTAAETR